MDQITNLRLQVYKQVIKDLKKRLVANPEPTPEELFLGCYVEMLEPQVREAIREMNQKGYTTESSGFYTNKQAIDGFFKIPLDVKIHLKKLGVDVTEEKSGYSTIEFPVKQKTLTAIKKKWTQITRILPTKQRGIPSDSIGSDLFRKNPLKTSFYVIGELEFYCARLLSHQTRIKIGNHTAA